MSSTTPPKHKSTLHQYTSYFFLLFIHFKDLIACFPEMFMLQYPQIQPFVKTFMRCVYIFKKKKKRKKKWAGEGHHQVDTSIHTFSDTYIKMYAIVLMYFTHTYTRLYIKYTSKVLVICSIGRN